MKLFKKALEEAKSMPKSVWIAAVILPGGLTAVSAYVMVKSAIISIKKGKQ